MSASEVVSLVREGQLSVGEVLEDHLARIDEVNPKLNAIVHRTDEDSRASVRAIERRLESEPLFGATFTSKINTDHATYPTDNGVKALRDAIASVTHPSVSGLLEHGAVMVGRTNSPAFAMRFHTDNDLHGETLNPHRLDISCGGSSGGAGVAVATGMCHVAQGNDVAGSVRWPAYMNGILGLRPTTGRMPAGGTNATARGWGASMMATQGPLARTMADLRLAYRAMSAANWADPFWVPVGHEFATPRSGRVALVTNDSQPIDPIVKENLIRTGHLLEDAGYLVEETTPPMLESFFSLWRRAGVLDMAIGLRGLLGQIDDAGLTTFVNRWLETFPPATPEVFMKAIAERDMVLRGWNEFFSKFDLLVTPMMTVATVDRAFDVRYQDAGEQFNSFGRWGINISALGLPALAFPTGVHDGAPLGVQIVSRAWREDLVLEAGERLEERRGVVGVVDPAW